MKSKQSEIESLKQQVNHWKANHDNMVLKNAVLSQRPDLPLDRIPACEEIDKLRGQVKVLREWIEKSAVRYQEMANINRVGVVAVELSKTFSE